MSTGYRVPATGNALGITTDSPGTTKDCAENTCTEDLLHARYFDLQYGDIFNPSDSPERLLTLDSSQVTECMRMENIYLV